MTTQTVKGYTRSKPKQKVADPFQDLIEKNRRIIMARFAPQEPVQSQPLRRVAKPHETALTRIVRALDELLGREPRNG